MKALKTLCVALCGVFALTGCQSAKSEPKELGRGFSYRVDTGLNNARVELIHQSGLKVYGEIGVEYEF